MNEQINFIKKIIDYVSEYIDKKENTDLKEFSIFFRDKLMMEEKLELDEKFDKNNFVEYKRYPEIEFSTLLTSLYKFAKGYIKKALENKEIKTIDEFGFLTSLLVEKSMMKNELIDKHLLEVSSGSEVFKRLLKKGMIYEYADKYDKRAKRVSITEKGRKTIIESFEDMHKVSKILIGNLSKEEMIQALTIFNKLKYFHLEIHNKDKNNNLDEIKNKYISD